MSEKIIVDESQVTTAALLKSQRKRAYEANKKRLREEKAAKKLELKSLRETQRAQRDLELWRSLNPASAIAPSGTKVDEDFDENAS